MCISTVVAPLVVQRSSTMVGAPQSTGEVGPLKPEMRTELDAVVVGVAVGGVVPVAAVVDEPTGGRVVDVGTVLDERVDVDSPSDESSPPSQAPVTATSATSASAANGPTGRRDMRQSVRPPGPRPVDRILSRCRASSTSPN
jgi:hypothetical protein